MISLSLSEARRTLGVGDPGDSGGDVSFKGCSTDSRSISAGQLFVALQGPNFDGHDYVAAAAERGAAAALVSRPIASSLPMVQVEDTLAALGRLAAAWRQRFRIPLAAITGSNGKTTVKQMLSSILGQTGKVLSTAGNLNNEIGVPLTLFGLGEEHDSAVIEMGANAAGEIERLARMAQPTVGMITLCAPAHLEGFGSIEGVARAKGEMYEQLPADSVAVLNADDVYADFWRERIGGRRTITFGLVKTADVSARFDTQPAGQGLLLSLSLPGQTVTVALPVPGRHNVMNALAAAAGALACGASAKAICNGLESFEAAPGRMQPRSMPNGAVLYDDTYNANPSSLAAALDVLMTRSGEHWLILGDMAELGDDAEALHTQAGVTAREAGVEHLWTVGRLSELAARAFGPGARAFDSQDELVRALRTALTPDGAAVVKGSRSARMERVIEALCDGGE